MGRNRARSRPRWRPRCPSRATTPDVAVILRIKEVRIGEDERFVICFNPEAAQRAATVRAGRGSTGRWLRCARTAC